MNRSHDSVAPPHGGGGAPVAPAVVKLYDDNCREFCDNLRT